MRPVFVIGEADRLLLPEVLPAPLNEALQALVAELQPGVQVQTMVLPRLGGEPPGTTPHQISSGEYNHPHLGHDTHGHDMAGCWS
jgi:hypothetical protein